MTATTTSHLQRPETCLSLTGCFIPHFSALALAIARISPPRCGHTSRSCVPLARLSPYTPIAQFHVICTAFLVPLAFFAFLVSPYTRLARVPGVVVASCPSSRGRYRDVYLYSRFSDLLYTVRVPSVRSAFSIRSLRHDVTTNCNARVAMCHIGPAPAFPACFYSVST